MFATQNHFYILLDIVLAIVALGIGLAIAYEGIAVFIHYIPWIGNIPTITSIVRPWAQANRMWYLAIGILIFAVLTWIFLHFLLPA